MTLIPGLSQAVPDMPTTGSIGAACCGKVVLQFDPHAAQSSRRRRLWDLEDHTHCPVLGLCLSIGELRRLAEKFGVAEAATEDYELHCHSMLECRRRTPLAESLQKEFDRRYAVALRQSSALKSTEALADWWLSSRDSTELAARVWAILTHARCNSTLEHRVLGEVHMQQHQAGSAQRVDRSRFDTAVDELAQVRRELVALQERQQRLIDEHARETLRQADLLMQSRAETTRRELACDALRADIDRLQAAGPSQADELAELARRCERQAAAIDSLKREREALRLAAHRAPRTEPVGRPVEEVTTATPPLAAVAIAAPASLDERAVLCVGGRPASVPLYRHIVERNGGRFMHHDGGEEQSVARLDATLSAADLVICQTGCISHDAYWRVKGHCKRTGTPCVFVENPGTASLRRALAQLMSASVPAELSSA